MPTPGWVVWCVSALLHFVSPIPLLNLLASTGDATRTPDVAYGTGPRHDLDIYAPARHRHARPGGGVLLWRRVGTGR